jgi:integrase
MAVIKKRHSRNCPAKRGKRCDCNGGYRAEVYSPRDKKKIRKTFTHKGDAQSWAADVKRGVDLGTLRAPTKRTLSEAAGAWLAGVEAGSIRNRSGNPYKPATLRGYRQALEDHVLPVLGSRRLNSVTTADLQALVDRWGGEDQSPATIRNSIKPLQAIYRRARAREGLAVNPTRDLELPAPNAKEVEIVTPDIATRLLDVLPVQDRALWATALYAGLRYGELRALRWSAVDLAAGAIRVTESWDPKEGAIAPKTKNSQRTTPLPGLLRDYLTEHRITAGEPPADALVFGDKRGKPFQATTIYRRADQAWEAQSSGRLRLHQARHTYASFMIAAGVNAKALSAFMGHSSIKVTFDLYGHLMPGTEAEAAALLDRFLGTELEGEKSARRAAISQW